ncbi:TIGR03943 family putative permease subunit [Anaeromicropila populeti]|uniref:TIGR03943 family protein n=1 Tax=Anaeromicropila populeti TaxID=37658 RepID=A0A1I6JT13_9FIRM|nr:GTP-binding protein [Anaeromicropila populeti]SFR82106.1 TIGR03943 family protein [Anaeromicropila populeti]
MEIPVYIVTGFLEGGKTVFIQETLESDDFTKDERTLLITCEEGMVTYEKEFLSKVYTEQVEINCEEELTEEFLASCQIKYKPDRILFEYNGMWKLETLLTVKMPANWEIVQIINLVNADTFPVYLTNMRSLVIEQFTNTDMVIFNRCEEMTPGAAYIRTIKAVNPRAQIYFETKSGKPLEVEEVLPYDLDAEVVEIADQDFGIWYVDAMDEPKKYVGKTIKLKGLVYKSDKFSKGTFVPGRFAMTCCADDIAFIGFISKGTKEQLPMIEQLVNREWVMVTAEVRNEFCKDYRKKGPVLYIKEIEYADKPEEELIYF